MSSLFFTCFFRERERERERAMSSFDAYDINGEEEINVNTSNSHFIDDEDEQNFTAAGEDYASHLGDFQLTVMCPSTTPPHRLRSTDSTIQTLATPNLRSTRSTWIMEMGTRTIMVVSVKTASTSASTTVFSASTIRWFCHRLKWSQRKVLLFVNGGGEHFSPFDFSRSNLFFVAICLDL